MGATGIYNDIMTYLPCSTDFLIKVILKTNIFVISSLFSSTNGSKLIVQVRINLYDSIR